jgi:putative MATE family efflux protein
MDATKPNSSFTARQAMLLEGPILKSLVTLAVPIILANVLQAAYQLIDAFWVGRLGGAAVAAVSISFPISFLTISLGVGFAIAGSTLIAQYFGAGDRRNVDHVAAQTLLMIVLISIVLGSIGFAATPLFLHLLGVAPDVYSSALGFMRISFIGLVFNFAFFMFQSIMRGVGEVKMPVYIVLGTVILNFALDPLFIYGLGPIPATGVEGAAIATVGTQSLAAIIGFVILFRGKYHVHLHAHDLLPDWDYIRRAFRLGLPASIEQSARALGLTVMTFLITTFGTLSIAAYGVGSNVLQVVMIPAMGLSMAIATLVGQNIGAGNIERAARIARLGSTLGFVALELIGVIVFIFAHAFVAFFVPEDPQVISAGAVFLRIMALSWGFIGLQLSLTGVLRASGNMVVTMMLTLVSQWILQFPMAYVLSKHTTLGIDGVWWSIPISNVIMAAVTIVIFVRGDWKRRRLVETPEDKLVQQTFDDTIAEEAPRI